MNIIRIVKEIKSGNLVITPTDTIYGILADALNEDAIKKVYNAKQRDYNKPLLMYASSFDMIKNYTMDISELEEQIISKYMPGKLTILLLKNNKLSDLLTAGSKYIGIRIPNNKDLIEIISKVGHPIITTSANIADEKPIIKVDDIEDDLRKHISYIEDGGIINESPSTMIKVNDNKVEILRHGELAIDIINNTCDKCRK